ncbi:hypothetical protein QLX08_009980 [Tetragonisca angustula]|uniref:Uncharacterized protein n=1 Tax=Tetragonisca angustula TaxID=166442 RepID=A0AAW0ZE39_9HYME
MSSSKLNFEVRRFQSGTYAKLYLKELLTKQGKKKNNEPSYQTIGQLESADFRERTQCSTVEPLYDKDIA